MVKLEWKNHLTYGLFEKTNTIVKNQIIIA